MFDWAKSSFFTSRKNESRKYRGHCGALQMGIKGFLACFVLLTAFPTLVITTSSSQQNLCQICSSDSARNASGFASMNSTNCCNNVSHTTRSTDSITENPTSDQSETTNVLNGSNSHRQCTNNSVCNFRDEKCLSLFCVLRSHSRDISDNCSCIFLSCGDGRCYNLTIFSDTTAAASTTMAPPPEGITKLQLILLFGSMGGILIFIIIVYCVKTFTDNRQRQYLLKHGVWDTPRADQLKDSSDEIENENKPDTSQIDQSKVPTITVEMENELSKSKSSENNAAKEEDTEDSEAATEEFVKPKIGPKIPPPDIIQVRGYTAIPPAPNESPFHENANPTHSTKEPSSETTKPLETIESPTITNENNSPSSWNRDLSRTPLTESPKRSRFPVIKKPKDPPKRIIANGAPEKSPKLSIKNRTTSPPQLVEPENFSDFGM